MKSKNPSKERVPKERDVRLGPSDAVSTRSFSISPGTASRTSSAGKAAAYPVRTEPNGYVLIREDTGTPSPGCAATARRAGTTCSTGGATPAGGDRPGRSAARSFPWTKPSNSSPPTRWTASGRRPERRLSQRSFPGRDAPESASGAREDSPPPVCGIRTTCALATPALVPARQQGGRPRGSPPPCWPARRETSARPPRQHVFHRPGRLVAGRPDHLAGSIGQRGM